MKKTISLMITLLIAVSACHKETDEEPRQEPYITSFEYSGKRTVDNKLWLTLTATVNPAGLQIKDAGFLMGKLLHDYTTLHSPDGTIVPCECQDNAITYDGLAKDYYSSGNSLRIYMKPYFVFEDGTEIYGKTEWIWQL